MLVKLFTSTLSSFDLQELAAMPGNHISVHQGPNGADVPEGFIKGKQFRGEVEGSEAPARASQPALLFTGQRRDCATQQRIGLHGGTKEWVGILAKTDGTINDITPLNTYISSG